MKIHCKYDELVDIKALKPNPRNPNRHSDEQIERLAKILEYQGVRRAVRVSKLSGLMTVGHGQLLAFQKLGWKEMPVDYQDYESEEMEYADLVADNSLNAWSELDLASINAQVGELDPDFDIDLLGIREFKLDPSELDIEVGNAGDPTDNSGDITQCPNCGHILK